jgi:hypothetical protein
MWTRWLRVGAGALLVVLGVVLQLPISSASSASTGTAAGGPAFTASETITRDHLNPDGTDDVVDSRNFSVSVDRDTALRGDQQLRITWTGAHPTGGTVPDESSSTAAAFEEYPVVIMECRGIDAADAPADERLDPTTCWTQTASERYSSSFNTAFPSWRLDRYGSAADTAQNAGQPQPLDQDCVGSNPRSSHWVPFVAADGTVYEPGYVAFPGCRPLAPEASDVENTGAPGNTTYAVTGLDGAGAAKFVIWTADQNASLGCSAVVACSLVVIPIMGVSCVSPASGAPPDSTPSDADEAACRSTGAYPAGSQFQASLNDPTVTGDLWWSASNWRNRVTVPLGFAESSSVCAVVNHSSPVLMYGSPPLAEATEQWAPAFCTDPKKFTFRHVQTGEPSVKNLVGLGLETTTDTDTSTGSGTPSPSVSASASASSSATASPSAGSSGAPPASDGVEAVLESDPPPDGFSPSIVQAPIALTGFAISYIVDDAAGHEYTSLKLTPRLLAKLMTESYPDTPAVYNNYAALMRNPKDITHDPEFLALNPGLAPDAVGQDAASTLYSLSSNADTMYALTSYINADPEARAWLNGTPDPWGMVVNPNYRGIALPVESWPLLDSFIANFGHAGNNDCIDDAPVPYLPLVASPTSTLAAIAQALQFASPLSQTACILGGGNGSLGNKLTAGGRQVPGVRFMLGLTTLGDAEYYGLDTAALQTYQVAPDPTSRFSSSVGRLFAAPTDDSLIAAARIASPDEATGTWPIPYSAMRNNPVYSAAYPGTMFVYLATPTAGLPQQDAADFATFIRFAVTAGQTPGFGNGQLPPGYAPMTGRNGLGDQVSYALHAASAVASQDGDVPPLLGAVEESISVPPPVSPSVSSPVSTSAAPPPGVSVPTKAGFVPPATAPTAATTGAAATTPTVAGSAPATTSPTASAVAFSGKTVAKTSSLAGSVLPSVLACGLGGLLVAQGLRFRVRRRP